MSPWQDLFVYFYLANKEEKISAKVLTHKNNSFVGEKKKMSSHEFIFKQNKIMISHSILGSITQIFFLVFL